MGCFYAEKLMIARCLFASREERRWMEKQNRRKRQSKKKEELARIRLLVGKILENCVYK